MLLQKALSGPLGSGVVLIDVEITSAFGGNRDSNIDGPKLLHGEYLGHDLPGEWSSCLVAKRRSHATRNHATKRYCPNDVVDVCDRHGVRSRGSSDGHL